jgi:hypothetical protein
LQTSALNWTEKLPAQKLHKGQEVEGKPHSLGMGQSMLEPDWNWLVSRGKNMVIKITPI